MGLNIYILLIYSCVSATGLDGSFTKSCNWAGGGERFLHNGTCVAAGDGKIGTRVFSDIADNRTVEKFRCETAWVEN